MYINIIFSHQFITSVSVEVWFSFGLWCSTPLSTIFQSYDSGQFYSWR